MNCCYWLWVALLRFGSFGPFWVVANFSTVKRFKHVFTAMKIHAMASIVKKLVRYVSVLLSGME